MITIEDMLLAHADCLKKKSHTVNAMLYELDMECDIVRLTRELNERTYQHGRSIAFVVKYPRYREVFAATFRDRIVHHYMCLRLIPIIERLLDDRRFNCREGKGVLYGVKKLEKDIEEVSQNYTRDCYIGTGDLSGFFMSIDKAMLADMTDRLIVEHYQGADKEDLRWVSRTIIMHSPEKSCVLNSPKEYWNYLSANKSLFTNGEGKGMPIGNLPSQTLANLLLWYAVDQTLTRYGITHGGYVDDFYMLDTDKTKVLGAYPVLRKSLAEYHLSLNEKKCHVQHYSKGVTFTGVTLKHGKRYTIPRVVNSLNFACEQLKKANNIEQVMAAISSVNSYLGMMIHHDTYRVRRRALFGLEGSKYFYVGKDYEKVVLRKQYRPYEQIKAKVKAGNPYALQLASPLRDDAEPEDYRRVS